MLQRALASVPLVLAAVAISGACGGARRASSGSGVSSPTGSPVGAPVLQFHNHATRDGVYVDPRMTTAAAAAMHLDTSFRPRLDGNVYAQPLYVDDGPGGQPVFIVATENNNVYALDMTGAQQWMRAIGAPAARADTCGNIQPLGITGTPVVDPTRRAIYLDAALPGTDTTSMREHEIHALSLDDGTELPGGWPVKASTVMGTIGANAGTMTFLPNPENQRGALLVAGNTLYVPYGGHAGDCADSNGVIYHGWIIGIPLDNPAGVTGFATQAKESGVWTVGGLAFDGTYLFGTTGNSDAGHACPDPPPTSPPAGWGQQEAILRFEPGPIWSGRMSDYWAPDDWPCLDNGDVDVGGSTPVLVDLPSGSSQHLVIAHGKDGKIYVADRTNLGGVGNPAAEKTINEGPIMMAPVAYTTPSGTYVVSYGYSKGIGCPDGQSGNLVAVKITPGTPPTLSVAWCAKQNGAGSPIFTTSDGTHDNLVWAIGADGDNRLRAWDADTGALVFDGGTFADAANGFHHFSTIIEVAGRIYAGADDTLYAYTSQ
jgi:hypothetical protein